MQNLREAIASYRNRLYYEPSDSKKASLLHVCLEYLERCGLAASERRAVEAAILGVGRASPLCVCGKRLERGADGQQAKCAALSQRLWSIPAALVLEEGLPTFLRSPTCCSPCLQILCAHRLCSLPMWPLLPAGQVGALSSGQQMLPAQLPCCCWGCCQLSAVTDSPSTRGCPEYPLS